MTTRGTIDIDSEVMRQAGTRLGETGETVITLATTAARPVPATAFGLINAGIMSGPIGVLSGTASALLTETADLLSHLSTTVTSTLTAFDTAESEAVATMQGEDA